jgi:hypothetical protein
MLRNQALTKNAGRYEQWLSTFDKLDVQFLVLDRRHDAELLQVARLHPEWTVDFEDRDAVLLTRTGTLENAGIAT